ncbi:MAG: hypothetical protein GEV08_00785 [Acidimicrobiia bacterium]|nr:hypothetical protein [Acidimicrobiia bacterium]
MTASPPSPPEDVHFDHGAAAAAVSAATTAIAALDEAARAREAVARAALQGAEGPFATHLTDQLDQARAEAESYRSWLESVRRQVEHAGDLATVEQIRRRAIRGDLAAAHLGMES